jgi:hypothetical protein
MKIFVLDSNQNVFLELRHVFNKEIEVLEIRCLVGTKNSTYRQLRMHRLIHGQTSAKRTKPGLSFQL